MAWWGWQSFDLELKDASLGNCDLCFMKGVKTLRKAVGLSPDSLAWWVAQEAAPRKSFATGGTFKKGFRYEDLPKYDAMHRALRAEVYDVDLPCGCTD